MRDYLSIKHNHTNHHNINDGILNDVKDNYYYNFPDLWLLITGYKF